MEKPFYLTEVVEDGFSLFSLGEEEDPIPEFFHPSFDLPSPRSSVSRPLIEQGYNNSRMEADGGSSESSDFEDDEDESNKIRVAVNAGTVVEGLLRFSEPVRIEGKLTGTIKSSSLVVIGEIAEISANSQADRIIISGYLKGPVKASTKVIVRAGGCLIGNVNSPELIVEQGGVFEGKVTFSPKKISS